jgi:drug/metabolite transporter (DMT)-like permease
VSLIFFILALRRIGSARTGAMFSTAPFAGALLSVLSGMEPVSGKLLLGGLMSAAGAALLLSEKKEIREY